MSSVRPDRDTLLRICVDSLSYSDVLRALSIPIGGNSTRKLKRWIVEYKIDVSHFNRYAASSVVHRKYAVIQKTCPVCGEEFSTQKDSPKEKATCSYRCSNTFFRTGWRGGNSGYRRICFAHHNKSCLICGESLVVDVHHLDGNRGNNCPTNLVPLCPTHHRYWHSKYRYKIKSQVDKYVREFTCTYREVG